MAMFAPFLFLTFCIIEVVCNCPTSAEDVLIKCRDDRQAMKEQCPNVYCGVGKTCNLASRQNEAGYNPHEECRAHGTDTTSGYCYPLLRNDKIEYSCHQLNDGFVPSQYENGKCVRTDVSQGLCGNVACPAGKFGSKTYVTAPTAVVWFPEKCQVCPENSFSAINSHACQCPPHGTEAYAPESDGLKTKYRNCEKGTFNDRMYVKVDSNDIHDWRPSGKVGDIDFGEGTPCGKCERCPEHSYSNGEASNVHCNCPSKGHRATQNRTAIEQCPKGYYQDKFVIWKRGVTCPTCKPCTNGSFAGEPGQASCICPGAGYEADDDYAGHHPCRPGTFKAEKSCAYCQLCPQGEYQSSPGGHQCEQPSGGHYALNGTIEKPCSVGKYKHGKKPAVECDICEPGYYQEVEGSQKCIAVPVGHEPYSKSKFARNHKPPLMDANRACLPGFHQNELAQVKCKRCPNGMFSSGPSQSFCDCASSGHISNPERTDEVACPAGKYTADFEGRMAAECTQNETKTGNFDCTPCSAGKYGEHDHSDSCQFCHEGKFQKNIGQTSCRLCQVGKFAIKRGATLCGDCNIWEYTDKEGCTHCDNCFTIESAFGFAYPAQCIVIWLILGGIGGLITLAVSLKFCNAFGTCCAAVVSMCKDGEGGGNGGGDTTIIMRDNYSSDEEDDMPKVPQVEMTKVSRTNTLNLMGDGSDTDEEIVVDIDN